MGDRSRLAPRFYIDDHAVLYALLLREAETARGAAGMEAAVKATILYGRERGLRMAMRCVADGKPLTPCNYLNYGEWNDDRQWSDFQVSSLKPFTFTVPRCGWNDSWKKYGLERYGEVYCTWVDAALVHGFNPDNSLRMDGILSHGAATCRLIFTGAEYADEAAFQREVQTRNALRPRTLKDFLYHAGHVFSAFRRTYLVELGLIPTTAILGKALAAYAELFGADKAEAILAESKQDYLTV